MILNENFNESIFDHIVASIRRSRFLIADLTEASSNVYWEAGFAYGLGMKVIYTCRESDKEKVKFNVQHNNIIFWKDGEDLYEKLKSRIEAVIY